MALFHVATITPTKAELIAAWAPTQPWGPSPETDVTVIGAYRFDDPAGQVGMEAFIVQAGDSLLHVPLTYRNEPLEGAIAGLIGEMEHSALGTRYVYDGLHDTEYVTMLAAVSMTGQGEALGMAEHEGRWYIAPTNVRIRGGGWTQERVPVDRFELVRNSDSTAILQNDQFELQVARQPIVAPQPEIGLTATWPDQTDAIVLTTLRQR